VRERQRAGVIQVFSCHAPEYHRRPGTPGKRR
jgi:hypothetical protein